MKMKLKNLTRAAFVAVLLSVSAHAGAEDCLSGLPDSLKSAVEQDHWKILSPFDIPTADWKLWKNAHQGQCPGVAVGNFYPKTDSSFVVALIQGDDSKNLLEKLVLLTQKKGQPITEINPVLRRAYSFHADILPQFQDGIELIDFCEISPELSRDFRGLRVWLPLKLFGIEPFRQQLEEKLDLAAWAASELHKIEGIEVVAEPQLSIIAFRLLKPGADPDALNHELMARINARQRVMLTGAVVDGKFVIRICVVSHRTHRERMEMCMEDIRAAVEALRA